MNFEQIVAEFRNVSDRKYDEFNSPIINSSVPTIGCRIPDIRIIAARCSLTCEEALSLPIHAYYEVDFLKGAVVSKARIPFERKRQYLLQFADTIENWAVCDGNVVKVSKPEKAKYFELFSEMCKSDRPFVCRYGIVCMMSNFLNEEYICSVFDALKTVSLWGSYYVDMAVAWLVATAMGKVRKQTVEFLEGDARIVLNVFSYNKSLQKIRDSERISAEDKIWTKALRRIE